MLYLIVFVMGAVCGATVMLAVWFFREWLPVLREWNAVSGLPARQAGGGGEREPEQEEKMTIERQIDEMMIYSGKVKRHGE